ncbi:MAG: hypothetical protein AB7F89_17080 [Pirellulaceae bacterium]
MKKLLIVGMAMLALAVITLDVTAQIKKGKTRAALTKQIMSGLVQPHCAALGKATKEAPADDKAWETLAANAALLNEASYLLMDDGRCPDGAWAAAAKQLREGSAAVLAKVEAKDAQGLAAEFKNLTQSCGGCHKAHKK